jgi:hypothetical protein
MFDPAKYIGKKAPVISGQEAIALEFNPPGGVVAIFYKLGRIAKIEEVIDRPLDFWFDSHLGVRIYERFGPSKSPKYRLTYAK